MTELWLDYVASLIDGAATDFGLEASIAKLRASDLANAVLRQKRCRCTAATAISATTELSA